jgi:hypothetical protein
MTCEVMLGQLFLARDVAHSVHLSTRSYAKHVALNSFYDNVIELADKFAEVYQGRYGLIGPIKRVTTKETDSIVPFLQTSMEGIEDMRYKVCDKADTPLQNIIDEIIGLYLSTLYKLKFLA